MKIINPADQAILVFGMGEDLQEFIYRVTTMQEAQKLVQRAREELDMIMEIIPISGYMTADSVIGDMQELLGLDDLEDVSLEEYIETYIDEERARGNEISEDTIRQATEAYEGGAR